MTESERQAWIRERYPVFGEMTVEEFNGKWRGKRVDWPALGEEVSFHNHDGRLHVAVGSYSGRYSDWETLFVEVDEEGRFLKLIEYSFRRHIIDHRTEAEMLRALSERMQETDRVIDMSREYRSVESYVDCDLGQFGCVLARSEPEDEEDDIPGPDIICP